MEYVRYVLLGWHPMTEEWTYSVVDLGANLLPRLPALCFSVCRAVRELAFDLGRDVVCVACVFILETCIAGRFFVERYEAVTHSRIASRRPGATRPPSTDSSPRHRQQRDRWREGLLTETW